MVDKARRDSFDEIPELYDEARPAYPEPLFEAIIDYADLDEASRLLEIGCGPGKATLPFARRGYSLLCLEIGPKMARRAAHNLASYPAVDVQPVSFEAWELEAGAFDLVFAAQAFHWIPPEVAYAKAAAALRSGGTLALFWHYTLPADDPFARELDALYREALPGEEGRLRPVGEMMAETVAEIEGSGYFGPVTVRRYPWAARVTTEAYLRQMLTHSNIRTLPEARRQWLVAQVRTLIERWGGVVERQHEARLYLSRVSVDG